MGLTTVFFCMDVGVEASKAQMPLRETMANENDPEFDGAEN